MHLPTELDELTYRLLASAPTGAEARRRAAVLAHWANEQNARLAAGRRLRLDNETIVAEALATVSGPSKRRRSARLAS